jgi:hypothetical protein
VLKAHEVGVQLGRHLRSLLVSFREPNVAPERRHLGGALEPLDLSVGLGFYLHFGFLGIMC